MKPTLLCAALVVSFLMLTNAASAQFGVGAGLAAIGDNIGQARGELADLFSQEKITAGDVSGDIGAYLTGRVRFDLGSLRLIGDASYVFFKDAEVTLTDANANVGDSTGSATFTVGTTMYPIAAGATIAIPTPVVKPYVGAQVNYTIINRTYTIVSGGSEWQSLQIQNRSAGDPELGLTLNAGVDLDLAFATLDIGARYNMMNVFSQASGEEPMRYLQVGASLFFGVGGGK